LTARAILFIVMNVPYRFTGSGEIRMPAKKALSPGQILAKQLKAARTRQGMNQQDVADLMARYGHPINRVTLAKIEAGSTRARNVSLEEAIALAAVLSVPPEVFFFGLGSEDRVAVTPKMTVHPGLARKWLRGSESPATSERFAHRPKEWGEAAGPVRLYDALEAAQGETHRAHDQLRRAEFAGDETRVQKARAAYAVALDGLAAVLDKMERAEVNAPEMPEYVKDMAALGIRSQS
jgi:transcriptional regulator with XRE-family HTH domain